MKKILNFSFLLLTLILILPQATIGQESIDLSNFEALKTSGNVQVTLIKSNQPRAEYKMLRGNANDVEFKQTGSVLKIGIKNKSMFGSSNAKAEIKLYYVELDEIKTSAGSRVETKGTLETNNLDLSASSGSSINLDIEANDIGISASSGARMNLEGEASKVVVSTSSGAKIAASELITKEAYIDASSGGSTSIHTTDEIVANVSSGGNVRYAGNPSKKKIDKSVSGGSVKRID